MSGRVGLEVFGGGGGCASCPGFSVELAEGGLVESARVALPRSVGAPVEVEYGYNSLLRGGARSGLGARGRVPWRCGSIATPPTGGWS